MLTAIALSSTSVAGNLGERVFDTAITVCCTALHTDQAALSLVNFAAQKAVHIVLFCGLAMLLWRVLPRRRWKTVLVLSIALAVGTGSEVLQTLFPTRDPTFRDVLINLTGAVIGVGVSVLSSRSRTGP